MRLFVVTVAVCCVGAGFIVGLFVAALTGGTFSQMQAELKDAQRREADAKREAKDCKLSLEEAREALGRDAVDLCHSQASIGLLIEVPEIRSLLLGPEFVDKYKARWFEPKGAYKFLGGK